MSRGRSHSEYPGQQHTFSPSPGLDPLLSSGRPSGVSARKLELALAPSPAAEPAPGWWRMAGGEAAEQVPGLWAVMFHWLPLSPLWSYLPSSLSNSAFLPVPPFLPPSC